MGSPGVPRQSRPEGFIEVRAGGGRWLLPLVAETLRAYSLPFCDQLTIRFTAAGEAPGNAAIKTAD